MNILDFHIHSENFYMYFFNQLYNWNLNNLNSKLQNVEAIDLIDNSNKIIVQVSATNTKEKIEAAIEKEIIKRHPDYNFKFISISKDASNLRNKTYKNPHNVIFNPLNDIFDTTSILKFISTLEINKQKNIYRLIYEELGNEVNVIKLDSNLAAIINILSKEDWINQDQCSTTDSFEIERKITYNNLNSAKYIIEDYTIHYNRLDKKYAEFDTQGLNKSSSVLAKIKQEYLKAKNTFKDDELFFAVIDKIKEIIEKSANFVQIPIDELELCVNILVVDAFIRCKIFENPKDYNYVTT
ncbi:MAG: ABC-three component system protein [bacterium]